MCKFNPKNDGRRIDPCLKHLIQFINGNTNHRTVASCCGHGKYPPSILVKHPSYSKMYAVEIFSHKIIMRKKRFYKKDKQGFYYIPEVVNV